VIEFERVTITYADAAQPTLRDVSFTIPPGELCLVIGRTGAGKSTLLGAVNGLVPHFTGGDLAGRVVVAGRNTADYPPRELAEVVGVVGQDPVAGFVTDTVEEELAYGMEQLAIPTDVMRKRVEETLDLMRLADLRRRPLRELSGGQQQRVAIGSVLTAHPKVLVLDEPTSALDPTAAEDVLAMVTRLVHDLGITALVAEHRLERIVQYADRVLDVGADGRVVDGSPQHVMTTSEVAPPVIELGRAAGWVPLPLSIRDARRQAGPLLERLAPVSAGPSGATRSGPSRLRARRVTVRYGDLVAVREVDLDLAGGEVVALMGRNGSGKSSLLWALQGSGPRAGGSVDVGGADPATVPPSQARALVALVPQTSSDLLFCTTVAAECEAADDECGAPAGASLERLHRLVGPIDPQRHPRDLSEGQRLALALAVQLGSGAQVVLLDEPTRGLDYPAKARLAEVLEDLATAGHAVVCATHDVEFVATAAARVVVLADGEIVADGRTADVLVSSPSFAPQVAKVLSPQPWLTVSEVIDALARPGARQPPAPLDEVALP
jgi:energy-coupling factor transporter ATP-binding protein EcfA2